MHERDDFCDDRVAGTRYSSSEADDGYDARGVSFEVGDVVIWCRKNVICYELAFVVLEVSVFLHLLDTYALMHQFPLDPESVPHFWRVGNHIHEIVLAGA